MSAGVRNAARPLPLVAPLHPLATLIGLAHAAAHLPPPRVTAGLPAAALLLGFALHPALLIASRVRTRRRARRALLALPAGERAGLFTIVRDAPQPTRTTLLRWKPIFRAPCVEREFEQVRIKTAPSGWDAYLALVIFAVVLTVSAGVYLRDPPALGALVFLLLMTTVFGAPWVGLLFAVAARIDLHIRPALADADALHTPREGRCAWDDHALILLGTRGIAAHALLVRTTDGRATPFTLRAGSLRTLLAVIEADRFEARRRTDDPGAP